MKQCPICEEGYLDEIVETNKVDYKGCEAYIPSLFSICDHCGSEQADAQQTAKNKQAMSDFIKEVDKQLDC